MRKYLTGNKLNSRLQEKQISLSLETLKHRLLYNPETGVFTRKCLMVGSSMGSVCGSLKPSGYVVVRVDGEYYRAHRLAWFYQYGKWPTGDVDHINRNRSDNRIENLRESDRSENLCNSSVRSDNTSGVKGVHFNRTNRTYTVRVQKNGACFEKHGIKTLEHAASIAKSARLSMHGAFANL